MIRKESRRIFCLFFMTEKIITFPKFKKNKDTLHDINFFVFKTLVKSLNPMLELKKYQIFLVKSV